MRPAGLGVERAARGAECPRGARSGRDLGRRVNALGLRAELLTSVRKRPYSAGVLLRRLGAEGWPSGQWQQTVNLPTYVYVGSNPTPSTTNRKRDRMQDGRGRV